MVTVPAEPASWDRKVGLAHHRDHPHRSERGKGVPRGRANRARRVVITGMGAVTPVGNDVATTWDATLAGRSGVDYVSSFDTAGYPVHIAAEVKDFDAGAVRAAHAVNGAARCTLFALAAGDEAVADADLAGYRPDRIGILLGSGIGGFGELSHQYDVLREHGPGRVSPSLLLTVLADSASGQLAIAHGIRGPTYGVVSACATGSTAIGRAADIVRRGDADAMLCGGTEACVEPLLFAGFCAMRGLAADDGEPAHASRPFDATRHGFVMGEGAGIVVLEELEGALSRGARPYAEVLGHGASNDAYHMATPDPGSRGVAEMMRAGLARSGVEPTRVGYINAHGTSTELGDAAETKAIRDVFGSHAYKLAVSSTKSTMGHLLGAAGAVEAIVTALALRDGVLPPTINYRTADGACDLDYVPNVARRADVDVAISNAMGLGGHNGCLLLGRIDPDSTSLRRGPAPSNNRG